MFGLNEWMLKFVKVYGDFGFVIEKFVKIYVEEVKFCVFSGED